MNFFFLFPSFIFILLCFVDRKKEKRKNFYSILQQTFIMASVIFNRTNTTVYRIPVNTTHRRLLYLPIRPAAKKLQILIDIFNHTLTKQSSSSSLISKLMGIDDDDWHNIILILGFTIIIVLLLLMLGGLYGILSQNWTKKKRYSSCVKQQQMMNNDIMARYGRFEVNFQSKEKCSFLLFFCFFISCFH